MNLNKEELQSLCKSIMMINHEGVQCDDIHNCEYAHQLILKLDKMEHHDAIRLLMHIIEVQNLQYAGAKIEFDEENPFKDMDKFLYIDEVLKCNSPTMDSLY
jgi:hypothetical protein